MFWGINIAVAAFTIAILSVSTQYYAIITPVLGVSVLVGIVAHTPRLRSRAAPELAPAA